MSFGFYFLLLFDRFFCEICKGGPQNDKVMAKDKEKKKKEGNKKGKKGKLVMRPPPDPLSAAAMENGHHMSFNAAIFLKNRGFPWPFDKQQKGSKQ
ncbi:hypothetical protein AVEN_250865-1 [Araneus ventricosus]|uniref:Small lysine-rich protein 1 n=1 Tax=Araneus ventricosus TaxID=182803 RepID=A0A4Y2IN44_ARAVE|nr:hypothetical protein AVEN_250865-1 [Araneus ventricosus]